MCEADQLRSYYPVMKIVIMEGLSNTVARLTRHLEESQACRSPLGLVEDILAEMLRLGQYHMCGHIW